MYVCPSGFPRLEDYLSDQPLGQRLGDGLRTWSKWWGCGFNETSESFTPDFPRPKQCPNTRGRQHYGEFVYQVMTCITLEAFLNYRVMCPNAEEAIQKCTIPVESPYGHI